MQNDPVGRHGLRRFPWGAVLFVLAASAAQSQQAILAPVSGPQTQLAPLDARALGMGGAFTAVAEGPTAVWWNPGALGAQPEVSVALWSQRNLDYVTPFSSRNTAEYVGAAANGRVGFLGIGIQGSHFVGGLESLRAPLPGGSMAQHRETTWYLGVGGDLLRALRVDTQRLRWGVGTALKTTQLEVGGDARGWDLDLGTLVTAEFPVSLAAGEHRGTVTTRLGITAQGIFAGDLEVPTYFPYEMLRSLRLGMGVEARLKETPAGRHEMSLLLAVDVQHFRGALRRADPLVAFGMEVRGYDIVALRLGFVDGTGASAARLDLGFGLGTGTIRVDADNAFSLSFDFASLDASNRTEHITFSGAWHY